MSLKCNRLQMSTLVLCDGTACTVFPVHIVDNAIFCAVVQGSARISELSQGSPDLCRCFCVNRGH